MKRNIISGLAVSALIIAATFRVASAADMPLKAPPSPPIAAPSWTGWYAGANIGGAWDANTTASLGLAPAGFAVLEAPANEFPTSLSPDPRGVIGGGQIGYNWQISQWLVGLEADLQASGYKRTASTSPTPTLGVQFATSVEQHSNWFGTVRPRVGFLAAPTLLVYATGGLAFGQTEVNFNTVSTTVACGTAATCATNSSSSTRAGWTAGAGLEYMFSSHWTARAEYLYIDLGSQSVTAVSSNSAANCVAAFGAACSFTATATFHESVARLAINYKF